MTFDEKAAIKKDRSESGFMLRITMGLALVMLLLFGVGGWATVSNISGAVIAPGTIVVEGSLKKVQHPQGGVVGAILVKTGDRVQAGDLLLRLDETQTRANLAIVRSQLAELTGRKSRLTAERDGAAEIQFSDDFDKSHDDAPSIISGENRLFFARLKATESQKSQLGEQMGQLRQETAGLDAQKKAKESEITLVKEELDRVEELYRVKLVPVTRVLALRRDAARIIGERDALIANIARSGGRISEIELQLLQVDEKIKAEAQREIRDIEARTAELNEQRVAAEDMLRRVELRAPQGGIVHELAVHTVGGVIGAGETIMLIVPIEDALTIEVRLVPTDIDQVRIGQKALLRFPAFNQRTTPELYGSVSRMAADLTTDPKTGFSFYIARIRIDPTELPKLDHVKLVPGMPVESFIQTSERTALSYLTKPIADQMARAFKEE